MERKTNMPKDKPTPCSWYAAMRIAIAAMLGRIERLEALVKPADAPSGDKQ